MKLFMFAFFCGLGGYAQAQDSPLTYFRILNIDSATKTEIYDRALIWCSKAFNDSKSAINVKEKESGIIAGKAFIKSYYKIPKKKDSATSYVYTDYIFDWLIEVKENRLRFSVKNISLHEDSGDYLVRINDKAPIKIAFTSEEKIQKEWNFAKAGLLRNIELLTSSLYTDISKGDSW